MYEYIPVLINCHKARSPARRTSMCHIAHLECALLRGALSRMEKKSARTKEGKKQPKKQTKKERDRGKLHTERKREKRAHKRRTGKSARKRTEETHIHTDYATASERYGEKKKGKT